MKQRLFLIVILAILAGCSGSYATLKSSDQNYCAAVEMPDPGTLSMHLAPLRDRMRSQTGVMSLEEGETSMISRGWFTELAEKTIDIQYFIFSADNVGLIAVDYFLRAAERGVKVRLLVDDITVKAEARLLLAIDAHPNVEIRIFNPVANVGKTFPQKLRNAMNDFRGFNHRMHNKTFVVDGQVVITGGRNLALDYFDFGHEFNYRDRDVLLIGAAAVATQQSFDEFWNSRFSVPVSRLVKVPESKIRAEETWNDIHQYACNPKNYWPAVREKIVRKPETFLRMQEFGDIVWADHVAFISDVPEKNDERSGLGGGGITTSELIRLVEQATSSLEIQSPYLITTELSHDLFRRAIARGVSIRILTNSLASTDNLEAFSGYYRVRDELLNIGVEIYEFRPDADIRRTVMTSPLQEALDYKPIFGLHSKSMVVDGQIAMIGTFNLDPRSANLNTECITVIYNTTVAERLQKVMEIDRAPGNAWRTTLDWNPDKKASRGDRFGVWWRSKIFPKSVL
jgi:phosphatidylserine/phosphatidylglycerophosphate/cardiolipin synthase-like enzyme